MADWLFYAFETVAWPPHPLFLGRGGRGSGLMQAIPDFRSADLTILIEIIESFPAE